jgi:single-strand DNA-binding protein
MDWAAVMTEQLSTSGLASGHVNTVTLVGRVSAAPDLRDLPSGDRLVTLRIVVDRPPARGSTKRAVDVIDVACWSKRTQRTATSLGPDDAVRVEGALRRRFFATGAGRASRYEVEASRLARVALPHAD